MFGSIRQSAKRIDVWFNKTIREADWYLVWDKDMNRYELLSPAGDYSCMLAAFNAGADAVYLAGKSFGARAFAGNFEKEELVEALDYAHLLNKKIYVTLNTLIKEKEFEQIAEYLTPFYEHGLDGVIIQDLGLIPLLKKEFPDLELHGSTQMTVSNYRSAAWLKKQGLCRVVPARELSLTELREIKDKAQIEVETFIHGAMCYCYSGQCLFSSFLGGRSGNRGRCAQPCRLPYKVLEKGNCISGKKEVYPLSLKDLCSIPYIYELMDAGMDSFKIEGRMKSPEYVAGVTAVYRKYMDYYKKGKRPQIERKDVEQLAQLYIRSDMKDGYFKKHNGKDMISLYSPSYQGCDDTMVKQIHDKYCDAKLKREISGVLYLAVDEPAQLTVYTESESVTVYGDVVQSAQNRPLSPEDAKKQMNKTGNSVFHFKELDITIEGAVFMPVKQLNELRRDALDALQDKLLAAYREEQTACHVEGTDAEQGVLHDGWVKNKKQNVINTKPRTHVSVMTKEQLKRILDENILVDRIYIPLDLFYAKSVTIEEVKKKAGKKGMEVYASLPRMIRKRDEAYLQIISGMLALFEGILVKSMEGLAFLEENHFEGCVISDYSVYNWNQSALRFLEQYRDGYTYPLELSVYENRELEDKSGEYVVYGRTPMMITANCIRKTMDQCSGGVNSFSQSLQDRYKKELPVHTNCIHCYNEIFNAVPMSLHKEVKQLLNYGFHTFRLDLTDEDPETAFAITEYFINRITCPEKKAVFPLEEYTQGHFKEGAV